jgi:hypothetical protein
MAVMLALWIGWLILTGLDRRYHGSDVPIAVQGIGVALIVLGSYLVVLTLKANSYAAPVVKIQKARGHTVATTGPYAYVRHPMYAGAFLFIAGMPLLLGSWWGDLPRGLALSPSSQFAPLSRSERWLQSSKAMPSMPPASAIDLFRTYGSASIGLAGAYMGSEGSARSAIVSAQKVGIWGCRGSDWRRSQRA